MYVRHAAFIEGVELFSATTFSINKVSKRVQPGKKRHFGGSVSVVVYGKHDEAGFLMRFLPHNYYSTVNVVGE